MIEVKGLYKSFDDKTVLSDINATFENGKTNLIIGQSGSGKTVLMKCSGVFRCIPHASVPHPHHRFLMPPRLRTGWWTVHT